MNGAHFSDRDFIDSGTGEVRDGRSSSHLYYRKYCAVKLSRSQRLLHQILFQLVICICHSCSLLSGKKNSVDT
jgi:hypothetical protein